MALARLSQESHQEVRELFMILCDQVTQANPPLSSLLLFAPSLADGMEGRLQDDGAQLDPKSASSLARLR